MTPSIVNGTCGALGSLGAGAAGATVGTVGVFTGAGAGSPRHVVVTALSGCAQLMTPSIVNGISLAPATCIPLKRKMPNDIEVSAALNFFIPLILFRFARCLLCSFFLCSCFLNRILG